ncbi:MAG TPA: sigma-70 family RNA polymerase sigma factor [Solirubrobacteraceae bacterium]|jgi:RNA polymerase sigma factor (sigma-70 family)|nr:sigma-70 family RNA polymerase sigma factor [Solirubrobacteraceae bacterium]
MATAALVAPISPDCSDVELVAAVRRGSDAAFEELYSRYSRQIGSYVRGMIGDHGRAEDITQEIFIAALRRMRATERPIAFKPWIYEIAKNACIDSYRRTRRAQEVSLDADDGLSSADRGRLTVVTTPDDALDSKEAINDLRGAFGGLSDSHHEILVLRELEGRSYSDIGERLGMSRPVVESTLFRARRRLAEEYDELASGRRCEFVHKMVDSGPHYSLGIRDRRRIARHLAHCQSCRAHARGAGFDESILNMPSLAAKIAAVLPIPLLRGRLSAFEGLSANRPRPSLLALRSVHTLASSSDQLLGAGTGAGRGAAAAAAIVLAGVGGGLVTESSYEHSKPVPAPVPARHASPYGAHTHPGVRASAVAPRAESTSTGRALKVIVAPKRGAAHHRTRAARAPATSHLRPRASTTGATGPSTPPAATTSPSSPSGGQSAPPPASAGTAGPAGAAPAGASDPTNAGPSSPPTQTAPAPVSGSLPIGSPSPPSLSTTLGGVAGTVDPVLTAPGAPTGDEQSGPVSGAVGTLAGGLGQVVGNS